jgi:hypothetical protein
MKLSIRRFAATLLAAVVMLMAACQHPVDVNKEHETRKELSRIKKFKEFSPEDFEYFDYAEAAKKFDKLVFDEKLEGKYLPLIWKDETYNTFGMPAYVGDGRFKNNGEQEAVTCIAAVLNAAQMGIDKTNYNGENYVRMLNAFYNENEKIITNNPNGTSAITSMWYLLYPAILYAQVSEYYPNETEMAQNVKNTIDSWYEAYEVMYGNGDEPCFDYTGFNFITKEPYKNDIWTEPDCAAGIAWLMDYAYETWGDEKYLTAMINCMNYLQEYFGSPLYELLLYYGPLLNAKLNALHGKSYDMKRTFGHIFDGSSIPRGGWGIIYEKWGNYDMSGLAGSTTDRGGYAFSMNTFSAADAILPVVKYDKEYAKPIGDWILRLTNNARYFFTAQTKNENQSTHYLANKDKIPDVIKDAIPYEGIISNYNGKNPWFGGDPTINGWAETDYSLYSGARIGVLGSRISPTNQKGILKVLVSEQPIKDDFYFYLVYNPYNEKKEINYTVSSNLPVDIYNTVKNDYVARNVSGETKFTIPSGEAYVLVEIPAGMTIEEEKNALYADRKFICVKP